MKKQNTKIVGLLVLLLFGLTSQYVFAQQQIIGAFPNIDGGFENSSAGNIASNGIATGVQTTTWTVSQTANTTYSVTNNSANSRTGNKYFTLGNTASASRRWQSPTNPDGNTATGIQNATAYIVQYYYRTSSATAITNLQAFIAVDGGAGGITGVNGPTTGTSGAWTKATVQVTPGTSATSPRYGVAGLRVSTNLTTINVDVDDYVVYLGAAADETAADPATNISFTPASNQIGVSWTAPAGGIDGGGYLVVRHTADPTTTPNVNGIYAVGNTIGSGTVVYIGATTSFTDVSLSSTTQYYYRIYTVDKAFNYSAALTGNTTTTAAGYATEPTAQVTDLSFSGVSSSGMTINFTPAVSGGGTNHLVVIGTSLSGNPVDGSSYTANTDFTSGSSSTVAGGKVVYNGTGNSVTVTGLTYNTTYYVRVYDFNGSAGTENYFTTSPAQGSQLTARRTLTSAASGVWGTAATWTPVAVPTQEDNVVIGNGHVITFTGISANACYNLTINSGGQLYNTTGSPSYTIGYMGVYGSSIVVNGTFGDAVTEYVTGIQFNQNCTLSGSGTIRINRMRPYATASNATFTFDADATLTNASGVTMMCENTGSNTIGYTINSGRTVTSQGSLTGGSSSSSNATYGCSLTVDGILNANSAIYLNAATGQSATLTVNGTLNLNKLYGYNYTGSGAIPTIIVNGSGLLKVTGTNAICDFGAPASAANVTGTGTFTLDAGATMSIAATDGLNASTGRIRCTTRNFNTAANYTFAGSSAQVTGTDFPATVNNLTINNASNVTLSAPLTVNGTLTLTAGQLINSGNAITLGSSATIANGGGSMASAPTFGSAVNINYSTNGTVTPGVEFPAANIINSLNLSNGAALTLPANKTISTLTVGASSALTVPADYQLSTTTLTNNGTITLKSTTDGTATIIPTTISGSGTYNVEQYLSTARNWYISSPVTSPVVPVGQQFFGYVEAGNNTVGVAPNPVVSGATAYWRPYAAGEALSGGIGYIAQPSGETTLTFSGTINNADYAVPVTRTTGATKAGFNLVSNPYPAYLDWSLVIADPLNANISSTKWYRTKNTLGAYTFATHNGTSGITVDGTANTTITKFIPPMQAFWIRVNEGTASTNLTLKKTMRAHRTDAGNKFKVKESAENKIARIQVANGQTVDESVVYFNAGATNGFDAYDSPKMFNNLSSMPEIYTEAGGERLVINGLSELTGTVELPLGFVTAQAGNFSLKISQFANFENGTQVFLTDATQPALQFDLTNGDAYNFSAGVTSANTNRFTLHFRAPGVTTGTKNTKNERVSVFVNAQNQIEIVAKPNSNYAIYNAVGQVIENGTLNSGLQTANCKLQTGIFVVKVNNQSTRVIVK